MTRTDLTPLTIPTSWHAGPHALPSDLVNYLPQGIWLLIASFDVDELIHALSDDKILALWVKQIGLRVVRSEQYYAMFAFDLLHNPFGGPASLTVYLLGHREESWYKHGKQHRVCGPANITIDTDGTRIEIWYENGKRHRIDGPAHITTYRDGHRVGHWYENDVRRPGKPRRLPRK